MGCWQNPNVDVLLSIFDNLERRDLLICTYACWTWNMAGNMLVYRKVQPSSLKKFGQLIRTISEPSTSRSNASTMVQQFEHLFKRDILKCQYRMVTISECPLALLSRTYIEQHNTRNDTLWKMKRPQQLGQLIKNVTLKSLAYNDIIGYPSQLMQFARVTPNVQTADIDFLQIFFQEGFTSKIDWELDIRAKWQQLKNLTLRTFECYECSIPSLSCMESVLYHLEHLNTLEWADFLYHLPHPGLNMKNLRTLKVVVSDVHSYGNLKELLQSCQNTLYSLSIRWCISATSNHAPLDLEDLLKGLPKLKEFALKYSYEHVFAISSFGDRLESLILISSPVEGDGQIHEIVGNAVSKTCNLQRLEIRYCRHIGKYMHTITKNNKSTLESIFIASRNAAEVISNLKWHGIQAANITTLGFHFIQENLQVLDLANIFPRVESLSLPDFSFSGSKGWIHSESLSQFCHLKEVDWRTFAQLLEKSRFFHLRVQEEWWYQF